MVATRIPRTENLRERDKWRLQGPGSIFDLLSAGLLVTFNGTNLVSVGDLTDYVSGTDDQIIVTDDGDGTVTISISPTITSNFETRLSMPFFMARNY